MGALNTILLVLLCISGILTIFLVLAHSGKGTGISDMIAASMYNSNAGTGILEKNLDRLRPQNRRFKTRVHKHKYGEKTRPDKTHPSQKQLPGHLHQGWQRSSL